jgi:hypothetical protein
VSDSQPPDTERPPAPLVTCLCVTHDRPQWMDWVDKQMSKQKVPHVGLIVATGVLGAPAAIAPKRNIALAGVQTSYFAWFDDDDWSHPERLSRCVQMLEESPTLIAAGCTRGYKIDAGTLRSYDFRSMQPLVFNSAVYRTSHWQNFKFNESLAVGEDDDWQKRGFRDARYGVDRKILGSWMCHGSNIANRSDRIIFHDRFPAQLAEFRAELEGNPEYRRK